MLNCFLQKGLLLFVFSIVITTMKFSYKIFWNRYVLIFLAFAVWIIFFDQNNLFHHIKLRSEVKKAEKKKQFYLDELRKDSIFLDQLENDPAVKEKFAREHYLMKRDDEVVFSIIREDTTDCNLENK